MRVTQQMISQQFIRNLNRNNKSIGTIQGQISSGKLYDKVSANPTATVQSISLHSNLTQIEQYQRNAQDGIDWSMTMEDALGHVTDAMHRIRELTVEASNDTNNSTDKKNIAIEIRQLLDQVGNFANTEYKNGYIFAGADSETEPYQKGGLQQINQKEKVWQVGKGFTLGTTVDAISVFGHLAEGKNLFETIDALATSLESGENPGKYLNAIDDQLDNVIFNRTVVAANTNQLELASKKLDQANFLTRKMLSDREDTDIAKAITELSSHQSILNASLSSGAKIIQQNLADFLR